MSAPSRPFSPAVARALPDAAPLFSRREGDPPEQGPCPAPQKREQPTARPKTACRIAFSLWNIYFFRAAFGQAPYGHTPPAGRLPVLLPCLPPPRGRDVLPVPGIPGPCGILPGNGAPAPRPGGPSGTFPAPAPKEAP